MKTKIIIDFSLGLKYCRLIKDINNKKLIIKAFSKKTIYEHKIKKEFPDSEKGLNQAFCYYKESFNAIFINELTNNKVECNTFINSLNIEDIISFYNEI